MRAAVCRRYGPPRPRSPALGCDFAGHKKGSMVVTMS